jgi:UDP-N-acetylmuramoylalanine--D-glutamate ligase
MIKERVSTQELSVLAFKKNKRENAMIDWRDRKVIIIGAARQGLALAQYLSQHGAKVVLNDRLPASELKAAQKTLANEPITWVLGDHPLSLLDGADLVCPSGGVPLNLPILREAVRRGLPISNDSQIFLETAPCMVIGITGSAGKTTVTTLVGRMAAEHLNRTSPGSKVWVGGNIGSPLISLVDEMSAEDLAVMELSSFQLEIMTRAPQVAAVLNITPNHLDRHADMTSYRQAKFNILKFQTPEDVAILNREDPEAWSFKDRLTQRLVSFGFDDFAPHEEGTFLNQHRALILLRTHANEVFADLPVMPRQDIALRGEHNLMNVLASCAIAHAAGISIEAMARGVSGFMGVPHRIEFVRRWQETDWYNDSIATTPERAMAAIRSFDEPLVLLAGGRDKNLPWEGFAALVHSRVKCLILFGECADKIAQAILSSPVLSQVQIIHCDTLHEAVETAARVAEPGEVVLLSPGGTSFDEFRDFEDRGEAFKRWVWELH